jgi:diguanylate cyclase (GGDEF)-like protein
MDREQFEELKHTGQLPSPSGVGMKILVLTQKEDCSIEEIVHVIEVDPALTGRIIKLATSVQLGSAHSIGSARDAAVRLGLRTVSSVALGFTLISGNRSGRCKEFDYDHYWSWSLACAVAAQQISRDLGLGAPAEAFTCALLSRIGRLALASVHPSAYGEVIKRVGKDAGLDLAEVERRSFRINHREVAAAMLSDWGLPAPFSEAVLRFDGRNHPSDFETDEAFDLLRLLDAASVVADVCLAEEARQHLHWPVLRRLCRELNVRAAEFGDIFERILPQWREWGALLRVPTHQVLSLREIKARGEQAGIGGEEDGSASSMQGLRILAVDDDPLSLKLLVHHLQKAGHHVATATNGKEALAAALETNPQIVVTDWMMPEMDGLELCKTLRRYGTGRKIYVLILTGRTEEDRIVEAFEAGVDDYVQKPFKPRVLLARIRGGQRVVQLQDQVERDQKLQREQVAKMSVMARKLRAAAMTDALTDLPNRRYAMKRLEMEWANSTRSHLPLSVIMLDIDHFKLVNDNHGHDVGDTVLQATAKAVGKVLRRGDTCARIGGEEFLVICPNTDPEGAQHAAERIRQSVEENRILAPGFSGNMTISLGVAIRSLLVPSIDSLIKMADEAVYEAKRTGRNRVAVAKAPGRGQEPGSAAS